MAKRAVNRTHLGNSFSPDLNGRRDLSIFCIDPHWNRARQPLPSIFITEPTPESRAIENSDELYSTPYGLRFPVLVFPDDSPEPLGEMARTFAGAYYIEGLNTPARDNRGKRIDCFRAAELLYLHGAARGDVKSHTGLGHIYGRDRCEGHYFEALNNNLLSDRVLPESRVHEKAREHYKHASELGDPEATYMLGDMIRDGYGCKADFEGAYECYCKAYDGIQNLHGVFPVIRGNIALRLGRASEEGEGCRADFETALKWYEMAVEHLEETVENGAHLYYAELGQAKRGVLRMRQELLLCS